QIEWLTFINDDDSTRGGIGDIEFRDVSVFEDGTAPTPDPTPDPDPAPTGVIDFGAASIESYTRSQDVDRTDFSANGANLAIDGNSWKRIAFDYDVTDDTILKFSMRSSVEGEMQGIGFDTDNAQSGKQFFQLHGTQSYGIDDFQYTANGGWQTFEIRLGDYTSGQIEWLTFINDDDSTRGGIGDIEFRDVSVFEDGTNTPEPTPDAAAIDFDAVTLDSYTRSQDVDDTAFATNGTTLTIDGNSWKKTAVDYDVTDETILTFSFRSSIEGEMQGIGFDTDNAQSGKQFFQLFGTQSYGIDDLTYTGDGEWQTFEIRLGDYTSGEIEWLTFINDDDSTRGGIGDAEFRDVRLYEESSSSTASNITFGYDETDDIPEFGHFGHDHGCGHDHDHGGEHGSLEDHGLGHGHYHGDGHDHGPAHDHGCDCGQCPTGGSEPLGFADIFEPVTDSGEGYNQLRPDLPFMASNMPAEFMTAEYFIA
ncbi:MAG: hypothetical protein WA979_10015, partial [Pacificimonas sp.]